MNPLLALAALAATFVGAVGAFLAAYLYHRWMPWRSTGVGRHLMAFTLLLGAVLGLTGVHSLGVDYPGRMVVSVVLLWLIAGGIWQRVYYVVHRKRELDREHRNGQ